MKCPKCNGSCRLKMTGAVCLDCNWYTHDRSTVKLRTEMKAKLDEFNIKLNKQ